MYKASLHIIPSSVLSAPLLGSPADTKHHLYVFLLCYKSPLLFCLLVLLYLFVRNEFLIYWVLCTLFILRQISSSTPKKMLSVSVTEEKKELLPFFISQPNPPVDPDGPVVHREWDKDRGGVSLILIRLASSRDCDDNNDKRRQTDRDTDRHPN